MATVNEVIERELLAFPVESVTIILQSEITPSAISANVIVLLEAVATVVELLQLPSYVIVPASLELKV